MEKMAMLVPKLERVSPHMLTYQATDAVISQDGQLFNTRLKVQVLFGQFGLERSISDPLSRQYITGIKCVLSGLELCKADLGE